MLWDQAGNTFVTARSVEFKAGSTAPGLTQVFTDQVFADQVFNDSVGSSDPIDFYRIDLSQKSRLRASLVGLSADADLRLLDEKGRLIQDSYQSGAVSEQFEQDLQPGRYYVQVSQFYGSTNYQLSLSRLSLSNPINQQPPLNPRFEDSTAIVAPTVGVAARSNQLEIDALLNSDLNYWDTRNSNGIITYSFYSNLAGDYSGSEKVAELSEPIKANLRQILDRLDDFLNVRFVEVADTAQNHGVLRYMFSDGEGNSSFYAYSYYPWEKIGGDVHLSARWESDSIARFANGEGSYGYATLIHETLHALGLKHPGDYDHGGHVTDGPFLPAGLDHKSNTIMSYNAVGLNASTPLPYDIRALQYLYGAPQSNFNSSNLNSSNLNSIYRLTTDNIKQTLWDGGGIDTIDLSQFAPSSPNHYVDLRPGGMITTQLALESGQYIDFTTNQVFSAPTAGTMLAFGTTIENVVTSKGNDRIIANSASNRFSGYGSTASSAKPGHDVIENSDGADVLDLSGYQRNQLMLTISGQDLLIGLGDRLTGSVRISRYFANLNPVKILINGVNYRYTEAGNWLQV